MGTARFLCKQTGESENIKCHNMLEPLSVRYRDIVAQFGSISHLLDNRSKRAWIGGIGTILKTVFGTLDENDALKYNDAIESMRNNQNKMAALVKKNILITESVISSYNDTVWKIQHNEATLNQAIDELSQNIRNLSVISNRLEHEANINFILNSIETSVLALSFQLEDIVSAIIISSQNMLHPGVITPLQLYRELADNYRHLPGHLELPIELDLSSVHAILSISNVICYYVNNKIVFVLQIPLVQTKEYLLFHSIALPMPHNTNNLDSFSLIVPGTSHIAMTKDKTSYCNVKDFEKCVNLNSETYMCDVSEVFTTDSKPSCESELISKVITKVPTQCETRFIFGKLDIWKPLTNNRWIFILSERSKISLECVNSKLYEANILGVGIITLPSDCTAYCRSTVLIPQTYNLYNITCPIAIPDFNLINDTCCNSDKLSNVKSSVFPIQLEHLNLDSLNLDNNILHNLYKDIDETTDSPHMVRYGTHYSVLIYLIIFVIILYLCFKLYCMYRPGRNLDNKIPRLQNIEIVNINSDPDSGDTESIPPPTIRHLV